jgi:hypothetical protein
MFFGYAVLMQKKRPPGRPPGQPYPVRKLLRLSEERAAELEKLSRKWGCTEAEAMRRSIKETAEREGVS